jgi:hypothetical protein
VSGTANRGPLVTLVAAALVGAGLLTADVLTDPAGGRVETPVAAAATTTAPAATTTAPPSATPSATTTTTTTTTTAISTASATAAAAPATAAAYLAEAVYVGRDAARRTSVAIAVRNGKVAAYVCDGKALESWLTGTASGTTATLTSGADRLVAELVTGGLRVTGTVRGRSLAVTATLASAPAGLYRLSTTNGTTVGWILQPDGTQVGLQTNATAVVPAPILVPSQPVTVDGQLAYPKEVSGDDRF